MGSVCLQCNGWDADNEPSSASLPNNMLDTSLASTTRKIHPLALASPSRAASLANGRANAAQGEVQTYNGTQEWLCGIQDVTWHAHEQCQLRSRDENAAQRDTGLLARPLSEHV